MAEKRVIDWEGVERDYRAGVLSLREISDAYEVSHVAIMKRAKRDSWDRDLAARIAAKAEALVTRQAVTKEVTKNDLVTERQIVEANAMRIAEIRSSHRTDIGKFQGLVTKLRDELETAADELTLPQRAQVAKTLGETLKTMIALEREAWGIVTQPEAPPPPAVIDPMEGARRIAFVLSQAAFMVERDAG